MHFAAVAGWAAGTQGSQAHHLPPQLGGAVTTKQFHEIFDLEVAAISRRRKEHGLPEISLEKEDRQRDETPVMRPTSGSNVVGLALSGGGIRSSAFCLGALQALDVWRLIDRIDYLSTVSGGGYIGTSMTAAMSAGTGGKFPFASQLRTGEVAGVEHIRDHSNYLFPQGMLNIFGNVAVYLRGIFANVVLILPWLLLAAALTVWLFPTLNALTDGETAGLFSYLPMSAREFDLTLNLLVAFIILLAAWALWRSAPWARSGSDVGLGARIFGSFLLALLVFAFLELQPFILRGLVKAAQPFGGLAASAFPYLQGLTAFFASIGTVVGFLARFVADALKRAKETPGLMAFVSGLLLKLAMYVAGVAIPFVIWVAYLYLCVSAIQPAAWLTKLAQISPFSGHPILLLYLAVGIVFLGLSALLDANANSLHRLYRDRLSKAFLFDPTRRQYIGGLPAKTTTGPEANPHFRDADLLPLDQSKVSGLAPELAPYHLINTALNIEASKYANRRGRNADFFIFSPLFTGSASTNYVDTELMEKNSPDLTAGTAMAISGAAASSNMGSATIKPLVPTLATLNVRLGYWLSNPGKVAGTLNKGWISRLLDRLYFVKEALGLLTEDSETVYLTDGGHIENLGIYELLRRRCKLIIAVDAEADPDMSFGSLVNLQRYARIDFGLRFDLPWAPIRDATRHASAEILKSGGQSTAKAPHGPHCALGTIYYPRKSGEATGPDNTGVLLYIKSSLTGDENDYVIEYKRRNPSFPHETTLDQLFTEEQFEAYRNLGFHAVNSAFKLEDKVSMNPVAVKWQGDNTRIPLEKRMRDILEFR